MGADVPEQKELPDEGQYLLSLFYRLRKGRPITFQEVKAFSDLMRVDLMPWEIDTIMTIDNILENSYGS